MVTQTLEEMAHQGVVLRSAKALGVKTSMCLRNRKAAKGIGTE